MSRYFNAFYVALALLFLSAMYILRTAETSTLSFYGFAESKETEINYNYPVVVESILIAPGQAVREGQTLLKLARISSKEKHSDQEFLIAELNAESTVWKQKKKDQITLLSQEKLSKLANYDDQIKTLTSELRYKESLAADLSTIPSSEADYNPIRNELNELRSSRERLSSEYELKLQSLNNELNSSADPYREQIKRLRAEMDFDLSQQKQDITVTAPMDGLIGNIFCKEAEHISSYKTLLTFYEPHSGIIKGYVHEDLTLQVAIGSQFRVSSLKDDSKYYDGKVVGLGSRIVEIPARLRKVADLKTYGREVLIEIEKNNTFLQKEKVDISHVQEH